MKKILIVEDHADMRELLTWQIELMGFLPIPAKHGKEGVEKAVAEQPNLILLDIMMPGWLGGCADAAGESGNQEYSDLGCNCAIPRLRPEKLSRCRV